MRTRLLPLLIALLPLAALAQRNLSGSRQTGPLLYAWRITDMDARHLFGNDLKDWERFVIGPPADSFPSAEEGNPPLPAGNWLVVKASGSMLYASLATVGPLRYQLLNTGHAPALLLHTPDGRPITDAVVYQRRRETRYDPATNSYPLRRRSGAVAVLYHDETAWFQVEAQAMKRGGRPFWWFWSRSNYSYSRSYSSRYHSFFVTSKPKYKPGDTVAAKAFIMDHRGRPIDRPLALRLSDNRNGKDTVLALVQPYRPGGYSFRFALTDSLGLELDDRYVLTLEEPKKERRGDDDDVHDPGKVLTRSNFDFEEYDLRSIRLQARTDRTDNSPGIPVSIYLQALDENDLPVPDARVRIALLTNRDVDRFDRPAVFIPDTLWQWTQPLDPIGETRIILPDSIFPPASFSYTVHCDLLNSDNESASKALELNWMDDPGRIVFREHDDSLDIHFLQRGHSAPAGAIIEALSDNEEVLSADTARLPGSLRVDPYATHYSVTAFVASDTLDAEHPVSSDNGSSVSCVSRHTRDSVTIDVRGPFPFWYNLLKGRRLVRQGFSDRFRYVAKTSSATPYFLTVQYMQSGRMQKRLFSVTYSERLLHLDVRQPSFAYPGQQAEIAVQVDDAQGNPVPNADVTAFSYTSKFTTRPPSIPYLGKSFRWPVIGSYQLPADKKDLEANVPLVWSQWGGRLGLDTVEFYQFLNPSTVVVNREPTADGLTELAPFVTRKGQPRAVHLVYIDEQLVYFSGAASVTRYSFPVSPGRHFLRLRTADREIEADSIVTLKGMKTFICINDDTANKAVVIFNRPDTLTNLEKALLQHSMILVRNSFGRHFTTISQGGHRLYLMSPSHVYAPSPDLFLAGPLSDQPAQLEAKDDFTQSFEPEAGYEFIIRQGLIREKQWPSPNAFAIHLEQGLPDVPLSDRSLTSTGVDSLWENYLDDRNANQEIYHRPTLYREHNGLLRIGGLPDHGPNALFVKSIFLFRWNDANLLSIYKGIDRDLGYQEPGLYRCLVLLKGNRYLLRDSLPVRPDGVNYFDFGGLGVHPADAFSRQIGSLIRQFNLDEMDARILPPDSLHFLFNDRYLNAELWTQEVSGRVTDDQGRSLQGVTVLIQGTRHATVTDANGDFRLRVPDKGTLTFAYVGCNTITKPLRAGSYYEIRMAPSTQSLSDVVVVGYSVSRKKDLSYSVPAQLEGKVAGVAITADNFRETDGMAYADTAIRFPSLPGVDTIRSLRSRWRDDAFWNPRLSTDANGIARFPVRYPDDITRWTTLFIAATDHRQTGMAVGSVRAAKPISARLSLPSFLVTGDSACIIGKLLNYLPETATVDRSFSVNGRQVDERRIEIRNAWIDTFALHTTTPDSLRLTYTLQRANGYFDGEERRLPVFRAGVEETRGHFAVLEDDTTVDWGFDTSLGTVHLHAEASLLPVLMDEIEHIREYEYLCNEQLASKLMALLDKKEVYRLLHKPFREEKNIEELIDRLEKTRKGAALWGWWPESSGLPWVSLHVTEALLAAEKEGYTLHLDKRGLTGYLVWSLGDAKGTDGLIALRMLQELDARVDYRRYIDTIEAHFDRKNLYTTLRLQELRQCAGLTTRLDTLLPHRRTTALGNCYWGEDGSRFFDNAIQNTVLMYRMLRRAGGHDDLLRKMRDFLLQKRGTGHWRNTYESTLILQTLLPDLLKDSLAPPTPSLTIDGQAIRSFPYDTVVAPAERLRANERGPLPVFLTAFQRTWNPAPTRADGVFTVHTSFEHEDRNVRLLNAGEPVTLRVEVDVMEDADYVMIEVPIPAGCSYNNKSQSYWNAEVHREYFKNKLSIFCQALEAGKHFFTVELMPRFTGVYQLNPAVAEMMYFPVFYGREGLSKIAIQ